MMIWILATMMVILPSLSGTIHADEGSGEILSVRKDVYLEREGKRTKTKAETILRTKDTVATDLRSRAKLYFSDDSILNLGELSRINVEEYLYNSSEDRSRSVYKLLEGAAKVHVGRSDLEIHSPTAVAAARGTEFYLTVQDCGKSLGASGTNDSGSCKETCIFVLEGEVTLKNINQDVSGTVTVKAGETSCVPLNEPPTEAFRFTPDKTRDLAEGTSVLGDYPMKKKMASIFMEGIPNVPLPNVEQEPQEGLTTVTVIVKYPTTP